MGHAMTLELLYQPYFCEENIWQLARRGDLIHPDSEVVFISNQNQGVACWNQRGTTSDEAIVWDYHVVLLEPGKPARIWDFDSTLRNSELGMGPLPARDWIRWTFLTPDYVKEEYHPLFRVIGIRDYVTHFASDRSHMRDAQGAYYQTPPHWEAPNAPGMNLERYRLMSQLGPDEVPYGRVMSRTEFESHVQSIEDQIQGAVLA